MIYSKWFQWFCDTIPVWRPVLLVCFYCYMKFLLPRSTFRIFLTEKTTFEDGSWFHRRSSSLCASSIVFLRCFEIIWNVYPLSIKWQRRCPDFSFFVSFKIWKGVMIWDILLIEIGAFFLSTGIFVVTFVLLE